MTSSSSPSPCITVEPVVDGVNGITKYYIRRVAPYEHMFATDTKARWIGTPLLDVYLKEFLGHSKAYYQDAIAKGTIQVNGQRSHSLYPLQNGDRLSHLFTVHEPPVVMPHRTIPILYETDDLVVVDKPSSMVVHPSGSSRHNSLLKVLELQLQQSTNDNRNRGSQDITTSGGESTMNLRLYAIHRLDRVTSGICLFAKSSAAAKQWSINSTRPCQQGAVQKWYLARVRGIFPTGNRRIPGLSIKDGTRIVNGVCVNTDVNCLPTTQRRSREDDAFGYWTTHASVPGCSSSLSRSVLQQIAEFQRPLDYWLAHDVETSQKPWLNVACPILIRNKGKCEAGAFRDISDDEYYKSVKPAHTAFGVVTAFPDGTTLVVCQPSTGRSHQIRQHLAILGHAIANDTNYLDGGTDDDTASTTKTADTVNHGIWLRAIQYRVHGQCFRARAPHWAKP